MGLAGRRQRGPHRTPSPSLCFCDSCAPVIEMHSSASPGRPYNVNATYLASDSNVLLFYHVRFSCPVYIHVVHFLSNLPADITTLPSSSNSSISRNSISSSSWQVTSKLYFIHTLQPRDQKKHHYIQYLTLLGKTEHFLNLLNRFTETNKRSWGRESEAKYSILSSN